MHFIYVTCSSLKISHFIIINADSQAENLSHQQAISDPDITSFFLSSVFYSHFKQHKHWQKKIQHHSNFPLCPPCRSDRTMFSPTSSTFTREIADPLTPAQQPQCSVGTETQRIMGKEVKEEQNRLKGCVVSSYGIFILLLDKPRCGSQQGEKSSASSRPMTSWLNKVTHFGK